MGGHGAVTAGILALCAAAYPYGPAVAEGEGFEKLSIYLERNIQDRDAEIRLEITGPEDGLGTLKVTAPGGRTILDLRAPESKLGLRSFSIESPEPPNGAVQADFPAGVYRIEGRTKRGATVRGEATLSHRFPQPAALEFPRPGQQDVPATDVTIRWSAPEGIEACMVVVEQAGSPFEIRALLPGPTKAFAVPAGFLRAGQAYKVAIGTVAKDGNRSFVEAEFATARGQ